MTPATPCGERMPLGRTGLTVARLGVGAVTWGDPASMPPWLPPKLFYGPSDGRVAEEAALEASLAAGADLVDTASIYGAGASERRVGELARGRDVFVATKFPPTPFTGAGNLPAALGASLARLGRPAADLYQVHFPLPWMSIPRLMDLLADEVGRGRIRAVGVSNYSARRMRAAHEALARRGVPLASNQVRYSLLHRAVETNGVLDACRELGVTLIAYSPLARGALSGRYARVSEARRPLPVIRYVSRGRAGAFEALVTLLRSVAARHGRTPGQVALRWLIERDGVLPIPGARNGAQAAENAGALGFRLDRGDVAALDRASEPWRQPGPPAGRELPPRGDAATGKVERGGRGA